VIEVTHHSTSQALISIQSLESSQSNYDPLYIDIYRFFQKRFFKKNSLKSSQQQDKPPLNGREAYIFSK
jgi:hypothetical protein